MGRADTFIQTSNPALCWQKQFVYSLKIIHKWRSLIDPFPTSHCFAFFHTRSFSSALYSEDFFDKCLMKSFEDMNILMKVKLFGLKNVFFCKKLLFKTNVFKNKLKKCFLEKKLSFEKKILEKNCFLEKFW